MKSGDGGTAYQNDNDFLEDCFIWCCLTDKNKCWSKDKVNNKTNLLGVIILFFLSLKYIIKSI